MARWFKFNAVGWMGAVVQLAVLAGLSRLGAQYLVATALAVEAALLHNYAWHIRWTWPERVGRPGRLWRFHLANGAISMASNLLWMRLLAGWLGIGVVPANAIAILATSILNFLVGDRWVFRAAPAEACSAQRPDGGFERRF